MRRILLFIIVIVMICMPIILYILNEELFFTVSCILCWLLLVTLVILLLCIAFGGFLRIKALLFTIKSNNRSTNLCIGKNVHFYNPRSIKIGNNVKIGHDTEFFPLLKYHNHNYDPKIVIGNNVIIGDYNRFACCEQIIIEDNVLLAAFVHITDHSHEYRNVYTPIKEDGIFSKGPVKIGKNSWIGIRCSVLSGVTIGDHCVVAAGSVVTHDVPPYSVDAGSPAKIIKKYDFIKNEWVNANN